MNKKETELYNGGYILLHRKMLKWGWYDDPNTFRLFIHCLLKANYQDKSWRGVLVKRGSFITGRNSLSKELGISAQSIRTSLTKLKSTSELTIKTTNKYSVVTVNNYNKYQESTNKSTNEQPTTNQQLTTTKEYKKEKNNHSGVLESGITDEILTTYNTELGTNYKTLPYKNIEYWLTVYTANEIKEAIANIKRNDFWKDKMKPETLFRRKDPNGNEVDRIGMLLNGSGSVTPPSIFDGVTKL